MTSKTIIIEPGVDEIILKLTRPEPAPLPEPPHHKGEPGIDVSRWQEIINWDAVAGAGIQFAGIRATMGTRGVKSDGTILGLDPFFRRNWGEAKRVGIQRAPYHYFANNGVDPARQLDNFIQAIAGDPGELPPVLDIEPATGQVITNKIANTEAIYRWLVECERALGRRPAIYTAAWAWPLCTTVPGWATAYPLWVAQYTTASAPTLPTPVMPWTKYMAWQYTSKGKVAGIEGDVDLNRWGDYP